MRAGALRSASTPVAATDEIGKDGIHMLAGE